MRPRVRIFAPSEVDQILPIVIHSQCIVDKARPNFVATLLTRSFNDSLNYVTGREYNGSYSATLTKNVSVFDRVHNNSVRFECRVIWMAGDHNETIVRLKDVQLGCE